MSLKFRAAIIFLSLAGLGASFSVALAQGNYQVPRTAGDVPDLQGVWTNNTITSLTRPERFGEQLVLSAAEARQIEQDAADYTSERDLPSDPDRSAPVKTQIDLADSYNNFWFDDGTRVAQYDGEYRSSLIVDPANGQLPALTEAAVQRNTVARERRTSSGSFAGPEARPLPERCLLSFGSSSGPPMLPILYNNHYQIVQSPGYVMILVEMVHDARIIRIDSEPLPEPMQPWLGDSIGHWEGDTLVVETNRFNANQRFRNSSDEFNTVERFTRVSATQIAYSVTVADSETFVAPFTAEIPINLTDERLYEYACHEGNYSLAGVLAGARLDEAAEANQN